MILDTEFFLACGFINGEIRIYSLKEYNHKFSINSNLRSIGPMIVRNNNEIISCAGLFTLIILLLTIFLPALIVIYCRGN